jgi:hypothetical protein
MYFKTSMEIQPTAMAAARKKVAGKKSKREMVGL